MSDTYISLFENENLETLEKNIKKFLSSKNIEVFSIQGISNPDERNKHIALVVYKLKNKGGNYDKKRNRTKRNY